MRWTSIDGEDIELSRVILDWGVNSHHDWSDNNLAISNDGPFRDVVHSQDNALRRVQDWGTEKRTEDTSIGDRHRTAIQVF